MVLHILALHEVGSNNPDGVEIKKNKGPDGIPLDGIKFHPYYSVHDVQAIAVFLFVFCAVMFFMPEMGGYFLEYANFEEADALKTPDHIAPVWYFTPFYSVLRAVPDKFWGFVFFAASVAIPFVLPWLDRSPVKSWRYRGNLNRIMLVLFVASFLILGVLGVKTPTPARTVLAQICTVFYFAFFLFMPIWSRMDKARPVPERVTMDGGIGALGSLLGLLLILALTVIPLEVVGAESEFDCGTMPCDRIDLDIRDSASLQKGAQTYMNYCMGCHSLKYARYNRVAEDLGIPQDLMRDNLIFDPAVKVGALMNNAMDVERAKVWFGAAPPDLTLVARSRSPNWLYTYLRTFYEDRSRPYGVNNRVYENVGMPHVLLDLQGLKACVETVADTRLEPLSGTAMAEHHDACGTMETVSEGRLSTEEYEQTIYDLVNFLAYIAEPIKADRQRIGVYVLLFIAVFYVFATLLNREYWKDVH